MSEKAAFNTACVKELERLKKEEAFIRELLRDVQKQLGKYKVEALHMSHVNLTDDETRDDKQEDDDELNSDNGISTETIDAADVINKNKLNLELAKDIDGEEFEEESDESNESELFD